MSASELKTHPAHIYVDPTPDGRVFLVAVGDELQTSCVLRFTPAEAAKLGQQLIDVAAWIQLP